jgi:hypothetical protein
MNYVLNNEKKKKGCHKYRTRSTDFVVTFPVLPPLVNDIFFNENSLELGVRL